MSPRSSSHGDGPTPSWLSKMIRNSADTKQLAILNFQSVEECVEFFKLICAYHFHVCDDHRHMQFRKRWGVEDCCNLMASRLQIHDQSGDVRLLPGMFLEYRRIKLVVARTEIKLLATSAAPA